MKIVFFHYHHSLNARGAETFVTELSKKFQDKNIETKIFTKKNASFLSRSRLSLFQRFFLDQTSIDILTWTWAQLKSLKTFSPDVVFSLNGGWQIAILRIWTVIHRKKLVVSAQSGPGWDDRVNLFFNPDLFVCLTKRQLQWATKAFHWPWQKFAVIPNGVDLKTFNPKGSKAALKIKKPIVLIAAAAEPQKRIKEAIQAVAQLKNVSLLWLGAGPLTQDLEAFGESLLGKDRFLHRSVAHREVPKYFRAASVFTLCSESSEAFGIVYLEALASGLSVVATDDPSRREIVGDAGMFVQNPGNITEYSKALNKALSKKWGDLSITQAQKFDWEAISLSYLQKLKELII